MISLEAVLAVVAGRRDVVWHPIFVAMVVVVVAALLRRSWMAGRLRVVLVGHFWRTPVRVPGVDAKCLGVLLPQEGLVRIRVGPGHGSGRQALGGPGASRRCGWGWSL